MIRVNSFLNDVSTSNVAMKKVQRLGGPVIAPRDSQGIKENWVAYESNGASPYWKVSQDRNDTMIIFMFYT